MKKFIKVLATACIATSLIAVTSCGDSNNPDSDTTSNSGTNSGSTGTNDSSTTTAEDANTATYTVNVKALSGYPVADAIVSVKIDEKNQIYAENDEDGDNFKEVYNHEDECDDPECAEHHHDDQRIYLGNAFEGFEEKLEEIKEKK